jgi:phenylpyruvate tautomerase PptA (4-oxalocrotonate tautomerase family)
VVLVEAVLEVLHQLREQQTQVVVVVVKEMDLGQPLMAALALSSFATQAHLLTLQA